MTVRVASGHFTRVGRDAADYWSWTFASPIGKLRSDRIVGEQKFAFAVVLHAIEVGHLMNPCKKQSSLRKHNVG